MDIVSPKSIWRDYDREALPLDVTTVSSEITADGVRKVRAFFNGVKQQDGDEVIRVYATLLVQKNKRSAPLVVLMRDSTDNQSEVDVQSLVKNGYAVVIPDYVGDESADFSTIYPLSMPFAYDPKFKTEIPADMHNNCWIVWAKIMLRAVTFACSEKGVSKNKIAVIGEGVASAAAIKACAVDSSLMAGISLLPGRYRPIEPTSDDDSGYLAAIAALSDDSYAGLIKCPLFVLAASNESDNSIDEISETYSLIPESTGSRLSISERADHKLGAKQRNNIINWLNCHLKGTLRLPSEPKITANSSDGKLYYSIIAEETAEPEIFVSQAVTDGAIRSWHKGNLIHAGTNEYIYKQSVYDIAMPVYAFVNISGGGFSISSPMLVRNPKALGVIATAIKPSRIIYENEQGLGDFCLRSDSPDFEISMAEGPFGIRGITAKGGSLMTYRIAEPKYAGSENDILQILLYTPVKQEISFVINTGASNDRKVNCTATITASPEDNWRKVNLSTADFFSGHGSRLEWTNVVSLRIDCKEPIIIMSIIWV